jgi:hypothetical protein
MLEVVGVKAVSYNKWWITGYHSITAYHLITSYHSVLVIRVLILLLRAQEAGLDCIRLVFGVPEAFYVKAFAHPLGWRAHRVPSLSLHCYHKIISAHSNYESMGLHLKV